MNAKIHFNFFYLTVRLLGSLLLTPIAKAKIIEDQGRTFLIDQTGERWRRLYRQRFVDRQNRRAEQNRERLGKLLQQVPSADRDYLKAGG